MINVEQLLGAKYPSFAANSGAITRPTIAFLKRLLREKELNDLFAQCDGLEGMAFVDQLLEDFDFSYTVTSRERENIPAEGRVVIVANHPLGTLDGLALLRLVGEVRQDVRIVANDILMQVRPLRSLLLPVVTLGSGSNKANIGAIHKALENDEAVIVFPSGEVSRAGPTGIKDGRWHGGFLRFAEHAKAPVLPVFLGGRNSALFYGLSSLCRPLSMFMLVREMFNQQGMTLPVRIGEMIPWQEIASPDLSRDEKIRRISQQVYSVSKNELGTFRTERSIAHPEPRTVLRQELRQTEQLGETRHGKQIYVFDGRTNPALLREIGRLREVAFRRVGEGSAKRRDLDRFDAYYRHLLLWDDADLQIAGAYRIGVAGEITAALGHEGLYSHTLFSFADKMQGHLAQGLELGRSFVQPRYWGMRSLDYLWCGIGAYLRRHPEVRYLFGPVSISNAYPHEARNLLVQFYRHYFGDEELLALARNRFVIAERDRIDQARILSGTDCEGDFRALKARLGELGVAVPTLYKQYTELCEPGGAKFLDFGIDSDFANCIDGLVMVDLHRIKPAKRERYIGSHAEPSVLHDALPAYA